MFSFRGGFGWGIGGILGKAVGVILVAILIIIVLYFVFPRIASAIPWILGGLLFVALVGALAWSGWHAEGRMRRRKIVLAGVLAIWGILWLQITTITKVPSEPTSTSN